MSEEDARLALELLVRTAQDVYGQGEVPVDVQIEQQVTDTVLGVPTTAPLTGSPDLDVLAPVSLTEPSEGRRCVRKDGFITVDGEAVSADGRVSLRGAEAAGGHRCGPRRALERPRPVETDPLASFSVDLQLATPPAR